MQKQVPTPGKIMVMAMFALSCFALLLYLWSAFGGPVPLRPQGYRFKASFDEATQLAQEADVRISGVSVGKVKSVDLGKGRTDATIELDERYAPLPSDTRAILRQKTLLSETYVEITPGTKGAPPIPEGGRLPAKQTAATVELDEILRIFDKKTINGFRTWQQDLGQGIEGRGGDFSDLLGNLPPFVQNINSLLEVLNSQQRAVEQLVRNTGVVFDALSERDGQLSDWIVNSNTVFGTTARRDQELRELFKAFPPFLDESSRALRRLESYADNTNPLLDQLQPVARELSTMLRKGERLAPDFRGFFVGLGPLIEASRKGLPAAADFLDELSPLLAQLDPFLRNLNPILRYLGLYKREITATLANFVAATQATDIAAVDLDPVHYLRVGSPVNPRALAQYQTKLGTARDNAYPLPGALDALAQGLSMFNDSSCGNQGFPALASPSGFLTEDMRNRIIQFFLNNGTSIATPCKQQGKFTVGGETTDFPRVNEDPQPEP